MLTALQNLQYRANVLHHTAELHAQIEALRERADKFMWQVRDTCRRAEIAEARAERLAEALREITELRERHHDNLHDAIAIAGDALLRDSKAASA